MRARVTPHYIHLVHDACLSSFWRKKSLTRFLVACGVAETFLATWSPDETKRDLHDQPVDGPEHLGVEPGVGILQVAEKLAVGLEAHPAHALAPWSLVGQHPYASVTGDPHGRDGPGTHLRREHRHSRHHRRSGPNRENRGTRGSWCSSRATHAHRRPIRPGPYPATAVCGAVASLRPAA